MMAIRYTGRPSLDDAVPALSALLPATGRCDEPGARVEVADKSEGAVLLVVGVLVGKRRDASGWPRRAGRR